MEGDQSSRTEYKGWWEGGESGKLTANERGEDDWNNTESPPQLDFKILMDEMSV